LKSFKRKLTRKTGPGAIKGRKEYRARKQLFALKEEGGGRRGHQPVKDSTTVWRESGKCIWKKEEVTRQGRG